MVFLVAIAALTRFCAQQFRCCLLLRVFVCVKPQARIFARPPLVEVHPKWQRRLAAKGAGNDLRKLELELMSCRGQKMTESAALRFASLAASRGSGTWGAGICSAYASSWQHRDHWLFVFYLWLLHLCEVRRHRFTSTCRGDSVVMHRASHLSATAQDRRDGTSYLQAC